MNLISLISLFVLFQGPFEASQSQLGVKKTSSEFDLGSFVENIKRGSNTKSDRIIRQCETMVIHFANGGGWSLSLLICYSEHILRLRVQWKSTLPSWPQLVLSGECMLLGSVSSQQRFGVMDIKAPSACHSSRVLERSCYSSQVSNGPCYSSQKNQCHSSVLQLYFIQKIAGKSILEASGHVDPKTRRDERPSEWERASEREQASQLWLLFLYVYLSLGLSYVNQASQECCFYLRSSIWSSDLLLFYFCGLFPSLSTAILDSFSLFYLPNRAL